MTSLVLVDTGQIRRFGKADFPVAIGLTPAGSLAIGPDAEAKPAAWILRDGERLSLQPEKSLVPVDSNGALLDMSTWLRDGDDIAIGPVALTVAVRDGACTLTVVTVPEERDTEAQAQAFGARLRATGTAGDERPLLLSPKRVMLAVFAVLLLGVGYVLMASALHLRLTPEADSISVWGFPPAIPVGGQYLALPGSYTVEAHKEGYQPLRQTVSVGFRATTTVDLTFQKLPGQLQITTIPAVTAKILVDGVERGASPATIEVDVGAREIRVTSDRYLAETRRIEIEGLGKLQTLEIALQPAWGALAVSSVPDKAIVKLGGREIGETPLTAEVMQGTHEIEISKSGWKTATRKIETLAAATTTVPAVELERIDGTLALTSEPGGATVLLNGQFQGQTPVSLQLVGERDYRLAVSKAGYEDATRSVRVDGGKSTRLAVQLQPEHGTIFLTTNPPGSLLSVNGKPSGSATQRLTLQTLPQSLEITRPGYETHKVTLTPQKGITQRLDVTLKTAADALRERVARGVNTPGGQKLVLIYIAPGTRFNVGAPRRDPARRSNEAEYPVELTRPFLISEKEVTNDEFRKFKPAHASGSYQSASLDGGDQPVVNVSWDDAARYANWLSSQEKLEPAYREQGGKMIPVAPLTNGYRLPTEAEWEFVARHDGGKRPAAQPLQFPWGNNMPPPPNSGNFAHDGTSLPFAIPGYTDGFTATAPVGKFPPNGSMVYDLGGNVAEWCHDYYDVPVAGSAAPRRDPAGPPDGRFHVIKGASWRSGSATELRFAYRDYAEKPRDDLGFRIVKYVDAPQ